MLMDFLNCCHVDSLEPLLFVQDLLKHKKPQLLLYDVFHPPAQLGRLSCAECLHHLPGTAARQASDVADAQTLSASVSFRSGRHTSVCRHV